MKNTIILLALLAQSASAAVVMEAPREVSFFEAPKIRVSGLPPLHTVTLRVTCTDAAGAIFTSETRFTPRTDGVVDTSRSVANGDYEGVDAMGPFWSLHGKGAYQIPPGGLETRLELLDEKGATLATASMLRRAVASDVRVVELRRDSGGIAGRFYEHTDGRKRPGILALTGSNGGAADNFGQMLSSNGYNVLALAYYRFEGLPDDLIESPIEYFGDALEWLRARESVDSKEGFAIVGASKGAEGALLVAAQYPSLVRAVVAFAPTSVVWEGVDARARFGGDPHFDAPGRSTWSLGGKPLPFVRKVISEERISNRPPIGYLDAYEPALERPFDPAAIIPVERIRGPIFLAAGGDDAVWPSPAMARAIQRRLDQHHSRYAHEFAEYPLAGHAFLPPGFRVGSTLGGTPAENARASTDAWKRVLKFLQVAMRPAAR